MKERPILFSGPMVRAILDGRKTVTRRVVKPQPAHSCRYEMNGAGTHALHLSGHGAAMRFVPPKPTSVDHRLPCPYGAPGDRLWVRETWRFPAAVDDLSPTKIAEKALDAGYVRPWCPIVYVADGAKNAERSGPSFAHDWLGGDGRARPGIHMPRWASRLTLEVTGVRVERLQSITDADAHAEGAPLARIQNMRDPTRGPLVDGFANAWEAMHGAGSWAANPWVWVVSFKRVMATAVPDETPARPPKPEPAAKLVPAPATPSAKDGAQAIATLTARALDLLERDPAVVWTGAKLRAALGEPERNTWDQVVRRLREHPAVKAAGKTNQRTYQAVPRRAKGAA